MKNRTILYACNPEKNVNCKKSSCKYNESSFDRVCDSTTEIEYAKLDSKGNPIITFDTALMLQKKG